MTDLYDGNLLVALAIPGHVHHDTVSEWREQHGGQTFATCPITQGTLLRLLLREGAPSTDAWRVLTSVSELSDHEFWPDDLPYGQVRRDGVVGHRQVTDAYLAQLARTRSGRLVTLDKALAAIHEDVSVLVEPA